jgi:hypothetical protein
MVNLNRVNLSLGVVNVAINGAVERAMAKADGSPRPYLGASIVGDDCMRKVQYDWWCKPKHPARVREIFDRGHYFEHRARELLRAAGFKFAPPEVLTFSAMDGLLRGHADGVIIAGPGIPGLYLIYPLLWEHKAVNAKNWRAVERDGLDKVFPKYAAQVALYQAYLNMTESALFTCTNADTCEQLHFLVPFDAERAQEASDRAVAIIRATQANELLPRAYDSRDDWRCRCCSHNERCWGTSPPSAQPSPPSDPRRDLNIPDRRVS